MQSGQKFKKDLSELYQGEILGEVLFDQMLSYFQSPDKQYKLSLLLQLETEGTMLALDKEMI